MLLTLLALYAPRFTYPAAKPNVAVPVRPIMPLVQVWLSTADRRLKLAQQPDITMTARSSLPADIVIDLQKRFQTMVGFGAAITDSSAWLIQHKLNFFQRRALLHELYGPPPNLGL
ncbi:MAG TPA: glycosyl hydrolase, partial [Dyella sp.]|nr:glycosyl hydrolase [Dyella sp.]